MEIKRRIFVPMITLTIGCCLAVFFSSIFRFIRELDVAMHNRLNIAMNGVEFEIESLTETARLIAFAMRDNHNLIEAIETVDRDRIAEVTGALKETAQLDFCTVVDAEGTVLKRVHEPGRYGDSLASLAHVQKALEGRIESYIVPGITIQLGIMAGSPVVDDNGNIIGAISLGYMMDVQSFTHNLKAHTGCEVTIFQDDIVISTTISDENGDADLSARADEEISRTVLAGGSYTGKIQLYGNEYMGIYHPIYGVEGSIVGMAFVGLDTAEDNSKIAMFVLTGAIITLIVLGICLIIARAISGVIEQRLEGMMDNVREAQEDLRIARDSAETASKAKSVFLANMSHEIRTPMNSIIGFAELAEDCDINEETREYLNNIRTSSDVLLNIINDILDISKIESGKIELEQIPFSLFDVFEHCQNAITPIITEKALTLYVYTEPLPGKRFIGDPFRLRQILMNLLSNAVKFTNVGMIKILASVKNLDANNATVRFEVKDSGIGINPDNLDGIFRPFAQADDSVTRRFGGTGLGLTITKNIVELMGGELTVKSEVGVGSTFTFELSFNLVDEDTVTEHEVIKTQELKRPVFKGEVLICEDNLLNQQVIREHLLRVGISTVVADNGKEGVNIISKRLDNPFDIIFMDIYMPVMDGLEASKKIVQMGVKTPLVALTANIMSHDLVLYREAGMCDTLGKPFTSQELWECLLRYLPVADNTSVSNERQTEDDSKLKNQLKEHFVKSHQETYENIVNAVENNDLKLVHRLVHTLKGNAGQVDEAKLALISKEIEENINNGETNINTKLLDVLKNELDTVLKKLAPMLAESNSRKIVRQEKFDADKMLKIFNKLEPLLRDHSYDSMQFIDELVVIPGAEELVIKIENLDYGSALETLKILKENIK